MKMAKASMADMEMAIDLTNALESISSHWGALMPEKIEVVGDDEESERFDIDDHDQCKRVLEYLILLARSASLFRVVFGMSVLLDPRNRIVDPDADTLERHPDFAEVNASPCAAAPDLLAELKNIANANPKNWDAPFNDTASFQEWAQSRARAAIAKATS